jgi:cystathionine beta-lyase family protein involved in aluminum resistance
VDEAFKMKMEQARDDYKRAIDREESAKRILRRAQSAVTAAAKALDDLSKEQSGRVTEAYRKKIVDKQLAKASRKAVESIGRVFAR